MLKLKTDCYDSIDDKLAFATRFLDNLSLGFKLAFMGNDINDLAASECISLLLHLIRIHQFTNHLSA